jgi:hypothetical protein
MAHNDVSDTAIDAPGARSHPVEKLSEATTISVFKKLLIGALALRCLGILGFGALAWRPAIAPIAPPAPQTRRGIPSDPSARSGAASDAY